MVPVVDTRDGEGRGQLADRSSVPGGKPIVMEERDDVLPGQFLEEEDEHGALVIPPAPEGETIGGRDTGRLEQLGTAPLSLGLGLAGGKLGNVGGVEDAPGLEHDGQATSIGERQIADRGVTTIVRLDDLEVLVGPGGDGVPQQVSARAITVTRAHEPSLLGQQSRHADRVLGQAQFDTIDSASDDRGMVSPTSEPLPLSVAIICMNSERTIGRTLESVAGLASEIVCIDSGSTDTTPDICRRFGAVFEHQAWLGHIKQKQVAIDRCTQPWVLCLDSDESLEPPLRESLRAVLTGEPSHDGYEVNRKVFYKGRMLHHAWQPEWRLRLVRRGRARWGGYDPHDKLELTEGRARAGRLAGDLRHDSFIDMIDYLSKQISLSRKAAESYRRLGRRTGALHLVTSPTSAWLKQMVLKSAWRDGWRGWAAASGTAVAALMKHLILLEETRFEQTEPRDG